MITVLATITAGLTLMTGCGDKVQHVAGDAAPVGGIVPATSTPASAPTTAPAASSAPASKPTSPAATVKAPTTQLVLGPSGLGPLKLGLTFRDAMKSGLLTGGSSTKTPTGCNSEWTPKSAKGADAHVYFNGDKGLVAFTAYPGLATPEGIKIGSTLKAVLKAYPDWSSISDPGLEGRGSAKVPGHSGAVYNITIQNGKVTYYMLQMEDHGCYE
ncbi:hypothetical protein [Actinoplanes sp. L3-i22]|uniref:hypothetical protein n=1 Tax=Actinoplanes sp. L3-i22 TaxID=2836373 RepID=UPI001C85C965|nr:hypothetical protein [Actinoplanes sp. L3-i22]